MNDLNHYSEPGERGNSGEPWESSAGKETQRLTPLYTLEPSATQKGLLETYVAPRVLERAYYCTSNVPLSVLSIGEVTIGILETAVTNSPIPGLVSFVVTALTFIGGKLIHRQIKNTNTNRS